MASSFSSQLETTFISEFVDNSGRIVHSHDFSFTSDTTMIPSNVTVAKIMGEIARILSTTEGEGAAVTSSRNTLRFLLENSQRPPMTVKFTAKVNGLPTNAVWDVVVGGIMDTVSRLVSDPSYQIPQSQPIKSPQHMKSPPLSGKKSGSVKSPGVSSPPALPRHPSTQQTVNSTLISPVPCKLPTLNALKSFIRSHPQCIVYVPLENRAELMPAVITSYPANNDDNMITCKLGLWRGATEITCRVSEVALMKEIPQFARMNAFSNPPASLADYGSAEESRIAEFLGIVEITLPGKSCERLKIRYVPLVPSRASTTASDLESREDEVPLFRCTLFREGSILDILKKRSAQDAKMKSAQTGPQQEIREQKFSETLAEENDRRERGRTGSRASKRGISEAIEVAEDADAVLPERRKSLRFSSSLEADLPRSRRSNSAVGQSQSMDCDQEKQSDIEEEADGESDELPLKENALLHLSMSPVGPSSDTFQQGTSQTVPRNNNQPGDKKRRNSMGNLQFSPSNSARSGDKRIVKTAAQNNIGRGRRGVRHSETKDEVEPNGALQTNGANFFEGEIFMILNAGEKSISAAEDESRNVDAIERKVRQFGGQVVELPCCNGKDSALKMTVICKQEMVSFKYLYAIAAGIPCVSYDWVNACLDTNTMVDKSTFLLPAGKDENGNIFHQRAPYTRIFNSTKIFVAARCKEFYVTWQSLLQASGAIVFPSISANPAIRRHFTHDPGFESAEVDEEATDKESETLVPNCEYVLVEPEAECAPSQAVINAAISHNVPLVTCKWLTRCFMTGRLVNPSDDTKAFTWWGLLKSSASE